MQIRPAKTLAAKQKPKATNASTATRCNQHRRHCGTEAGIQHESNMDSAWIQHGFSGFNEYSLHLKWNAIVPSRVESERRQVMACDGIKGKRWQSQVNGSEGGRHTGHQRDKSGENKTNAIISTQERWFSSGSDATVTSAIVNASCDLFGGLGVSRVRRTWARATPPYAALRRRQPTDWPFTFFSKLQLRRLAWLRQRLPR